MHRQGPILVVVALVLCAAGVAAAQSMLVGGSAGLTGGSAGLTGGSAGLTGSGSVVSQATPSATGTDASATTPGPSTNGVPATTTPQTTVPGVSATGGPTIEQIVSITRSVDSGTPSVSAFAVPAGRLLIVTDVVITNSGAAPACGASIAPGGTVAVTPASPAPAVESGTGVLCVPAQTSLSLGLTTGLEFAAGQGVVLTTTAGATLHYHLRGFLVVTGA